jgi:hypothetical protein
MNGLEILVYLIFDVESPQWGPGWRQLLAILCVTLSLIVFALGGIDPTGKFCLRTLSVS